MQNSKKIIVRNFLYYKFFNSLFLGLSVGSIFILYTPLEPSIYSLGGIFLALGMLLIAKSYQKILTIEYFYKISLFVELIMLALISYFLIFSYSYTTALIIYIGYQITFVFGSYLVRAETLFLPKRFILSKLDIFKQSGYLVGMGVAYIFYKVLEYFAITDKQLQVYDLHYLLLILEIMVVFLLIKSFKSKNINGS
jgi:hypothetical protein